MIAAFASVVALVLAVREAVVQCLLGLLVCMPIVHLIKWLRIDEVVDVRDQLAITRGVVSPYTRS